MGDLNCDLLCETISKSKHLVHIRNTYGLTQVIKEATKLQLKLISCLTYYIVTNKKYNAADSGIIPCGIGEHDPVYVIRHARLPKFKKDPKIVTVRSTKNLNNDTLIKDLSELPFELIRTSADNPLIKLEVCLDFLNKYAPVKTIRVRGYNLKYVTAEVKSVMRQRYYLMGKASETGSKYL